MPTEYRLILCDTSKQHAPIAKFTSATPFHAVTVGDRFDDTGWDRLQGEEIRASESAPIRYTVHSIKHLIEQTPDGLIQTLCLNLAPHPGPASPAWPE